MMEGRASRKDAMRNYFDAGQAEALGARLRRLEPTTTGLWGRMTAHEVLVHVRDGIELGLGFRTAPLQGAAFYRTPLGRWLALGPLPWPRGSVTPREMDRQGSGSALRSFNEDRASLEARLEEFARATRFYPHPFFGDLDKRGWGRLTRKHLDHHLRQFGG
jgi:Protein of unknown function (DUF1569)